MICSSSEPLQNHRPCYGRKCHRGKGGGDNARVRDPKGSISVYFSPVMISKKSLNVLYSSLCLLDAELNVLNRILRRNSYFICILSKVQEV